MLQHMTSMQSRQVLEGATLNQAAVYALLPTKSTQTPDRPCFGRADGGFGRFMLAAGGLIGGLGLLCTPWPALPSEAPAGVAFPFAAACFPPSKASCKACIPLAFASAGSKGMGVAGAAELVAGPAPAAGGGGSDSIGMGAQAGTVLFTGIGAQALRCCCCLGKCCTRTGPVMGC